MCVCGGVLQTSVQPRSVNKYGLGGRSGQLGVQLQPKTTWLSGSRRGGVPVCLPRATKKDAGD